MVRICLCSCRVPCRCLIELQMLVNPALAIASAVSSKAHTPSMLLACAGALSLTLLRQRCM